MITARVLICARDNVDPQNKIVHQKGHIVAVVKPEVLPCAYERLPYFVWANLTTSNYQTIRDYWKPWEAKLIWDPTSLDVSQDLWKVNLQLENIPPSGRGALTKSKVDNALSAWNITANAIANNEIDFNAKVYDVARSKAMLGGVNQSAINQINWTEVYTPATGDHQITGDYSGLPFTGEQIENAVLSSYQIDNHDSVAKQIVFTANRNYVFSEFKDYAQRALYEFMGKAVYCISSADVDAIVGAGGSVEITAAQLAGKLINRIDHE